MSPMPPFITALLSFARLSPRQTPTFPDHITVQSEPTGACRNYPDNLGDFPFLFGAGTNLSITCWTESSMLNDEIGREGGDSSFIWAWVQLDPSVYDDPFGSMGVGNIEQGGEAGGYGCWMHEEDFQAGEDLYLPDEIKWCGDAPHHQVGSPALYNEPFYCRNCTDLTNADCEKKYNTEVYGYADTGCWKEGTAVSGNTTWVSLIESPLQNCFISPEQFDINGWHGPPASECQA